MAPRLFRLKAQDPEGAPREMQVLVRRFAIEADPATGEKKVVAYCPNPDTMQVERE